MTIKVSKPIKEAKRWILDYVDFDVRDEPCVVDGKKTTIGKAVEEFMKKQNQRHVYLAIKQCDKAKGEYVYECR